MKSPLKNTVLLTALCLGIAGTAWGAESPAASPRLTTFPQDLTVWPNAVSHANSDRWLVEHHDTIRRMQPRLLVVNFSNEASREHLERMVRSLMAALAESSRYHGYRNPQAPAFLNYELVRFVDLREPGRTTGNSSRVPIKPNVKDGFNLDYDAFFREAFAKDYGFADPRQAGRFLRLDELVEAGQAHEFWFFVETAPEVRCFECVEEKPVYNERFERQGQRFTQAGNGGDPDQRWTGRSLRLNHINPQRGIGCAMENLGHALEGTANCNAIPYFRKYFYEFAGHDLDRRWKLPWLSFYPLWGEDKGIEYPDDHTAIVRDGQKVYRVENYFAGGGNVHFPPNGRRHYDLDNDQPVRSTIEDWRIGSGPGGEDLAQPWTNAKFARYRELAPDCMGAWLVYWRQNMPGLDNRQKDATGQPMKNWWPFLFY